MNDSYVEVLLKKQGKPADTAIKLGMVILTAAAALAVVITGIWLLAIPAVLLLVADGIFLPRLAVEYEYLYVSGELTVDKILGKTKRKSCAAVDMSKVEIIAPADSDRLTEYRNLKCKEADYTSGKEDSRPFVCIYHTDKDVQRFRFEPNDRMLDMMRQTAPRKIVR